jgi:hypothetical protein
MSRHLILAVGVSACFAMVSIARASGPVVSFELHASQDEPMVRALAHREITGEYQLARAFPHVALSLEIFQDGERTVPIQQAALKSNLETNGRLAVMLADLEQLPTVKSSRPPLELAPPRSMIRLVLMNSHSSSRAFSPVDTEKLMDLHDSVAYHRFDASTASADTAPLLAIYQGPGPVQREGVITVDDLLKKNPKGHIVVLSLRASDKP